MVAALVAFDYRHDRAVLAENGLATARALAAAIDRELAGAEAALGALATSPYLTADDFPGFYDQAQEVLRYQRLDNIVLVDPMGHQQVNTLLPYGGPLPGNEANPMVRRILAEKHGVISDMFIAAVADKPLIAVGVPVLRDGEVAYVLAAGISPERLSKILSEGRLPPSSIGTIFDSTGTIVARTHEAERFVGHKGSPALVARMREVPEDSIETVSIEGIPVLSMFSKSAVSNWSVAIGIPIAELTAELRRLLALLIAGTALLFLGSLALAWLIGGRIATSIHELVEPALALGRGELVRVPPLNIREANEVATALSDASKLLVEAQHQANHDPLTSLANRSLFDEILSQQLAVCDRTGSNLAVAFIDLDGFKHVNDKYGHAAGDEVLRTVATRLKSGTRKADVIARLGGDEFAVILIQTDLKTAAAVCEKLVESLSSPYSFNAHEMEVSASIGVSAYPESGTAAAVLCELADGAMYAAKTAGKRRYAVAGTAETHAAKWEGPR